MVKEHREAHASEWAVLQSVAQKLGCTAETLRSGCGKRGVMLLTDQASRPASASGSKELERDVRELSRANEILRKASAHSRRRSSHIAFATSMKHSLGSPVH